MRSASAGLVLLQRSVLIYVALVFVISWGGVFLVLGPGGFPPTSGGLREPGSVVLHGDPGRPLRGRHSAHGHRRWAAGPPRASRPAAAVAGRLEVVRGRAAARSRNDIDRSAAIPRVVRIPPRHTRLQRQSRTRDACARSGSPGWHV